jgi:hypothetical protein
MEAGRYKAGSMLWTEDWFSEAYASEWSYLAARMRCAARLGGPEVQFGGYIVPVRVTTALSHLVVIYGCILNRQFVIHSVGRLEQSTMGQLLFSRKQCRL